MCLIYGFHWTTSKNKYSERILHKPIRKNGNFSVIEGEGT